MEDETSMMMLMKYQLMPIIIIWSEFGNDEIRIILLKMLMKLTQSNQIVSFICQSIEKCQQLLSHLLQLKVISNDNEIIFNLIDEIFISFKEKNELFQSIFNGIQK